MKMLGHDDMSMNDEAVLAARLLPGFSQISRAATPNPILVGGGNNCW
jgi:hypothetical protein